MVTRLAVTAAVETLRLRAPLRISGHVFEHGEVAVVTLADGDLRGRGEAAGVYYLADEPASICETVAAHRERIEAGVAREDLLTWLPPGGARNALDCALWELESHRARQPVWKLAGLLEVAPRMTTFTIGADAPAVVTERATALGHARALKLKLDGDVEADIERVRAARRARPDAWIGVDANQGYTVDSLAQLLPALVDARVRLVEQPLARGRESDLEGFGSPIPLAADESAQCLADVEGLVGRFDVVNIKLDKCGGLTEGLQMAAAARRVGLRPMVGTMFATSLATAPGFVLAQVCDFVDLDSPAFLATDREPSVAYEDGRLWCPDTVWGAGSPD